MLSQKNSILLFKSFSHFKATISYKTKNSLPKASPSVSAALLLSGFLIMGGGRGKCRRTIKYSENKILLAM